MPSVIYQKPVCQRDIYQKSPNIFGSSNEKTGASPEHQTPKNTPVLSLLSLPSAAGLSLFRYSRKLYRPAKGSTGCGTQQIFRALGGTHISLTTAPTTPPCFGHWPRSSSLPSGRAGSANALTERAISTRRCRAAEPSGRQPAPAGKWAVRARRRCSCRSGLPAPAPAGRSSGRRPSPFPA